MSGFGVTRGAEGLQEMTTLKTIAVRRSRFLPHLEPTRPGDEALFSEYIRAAHGINRHVRMRSAWRLFVHLRQRVRYGSVIPNLPKTYSATYRPEDPEL